MFGRPKKPSPPSIPFGLADLADDSGRMTLPPDASPPALLDVLPPVDVEAAYRDAGVHLPALERLDGVDPVWHVAMSDVGRAASMWTALRALHPSTGLWPVLVSAAFWQRFGDAPPEPETDRGDGGAWLADRLNAVDEYSESSMGAQIPRAARPRLGPPAAADVTDLMLANADPFDGIVLVRAGASWQVPGILAWDGAVNMEVLGAEHTSVLRRWAAAYGAELAMLGSDTLGLLVESPPTRPDDVLRVAVEMTAYCPDVLFQGVGSLEGMTEAAIQRTWWFWWD